MPSRKKKIAARSATLGGQRRAAPVFAADFRRRLELKFQLERAGYALTFAHVALHADING
ncbi:hypothetical protein FACS1894139_17170 [Planctomycetales bacterium]|nr:hypothetical protein FACS1894107_11110 [Planctomycetales bacterium]GHS99497.1 hypothetical protein FACS1894108_09590 [Planctomycetales bacterium]GHT08021.1 hypothetical protein FACS1894139_17170 [Planctomycetales bacterium]